MHEIRIPRLGWSMEEGTFVGWLKQPGDEVAVGQALFELEGEKSLQEIESVDAGTLYVPPDSPLPGSVIPVGALLGYLLEPGEPAPQSVSVSTPTRTQPDAIAVPKMQVPVAASVVSGFDPIASPRARRIAAELGVNWQLLAGTGRNGRVREADILAAHAAVPSQTSTPGMSPRRKAIAERLRLSVDRTIPVTLTTSLDATHLVGLREQFRTSQSVLIPSYTDIVACLCARVLARQPQFALRWDHDHRSLQQVAADDLHIGIAVDTPEGLLVPVIRHVARKSLVTVAEEAKVLIERARIGRLVGSEMQGGTLTITNLGASGIDAFTPIINDPEIAILGLGTIRREAVVLPDDRIVPQSRMTLSLTFDHAAIDGAPAARLLREIVLAMESPAAQLLGS